MLLFRVLLLALSVGFLTVEGVRRTKARTSNAAGKDEGVPPLSVFIPPLQLVNIMTSGNASNETDARSHLILEPLLALLNEEEVQLLASIFPNLFPPGTVPEFSDKDQSIGRRSANNTSTVTSSPSMFLTTSAPRMESKNFQEKKRENDNDDALIMWLLKGKNESFPISSLVSSTPSIRSIDEPSAPPLVRVTDDMLIVMLQRLMENMTTAEIPTTTVPSELPGPVAIGDDLLSVLLKTLHTKAQETTTPAFDDSIIFNLTRSTTTSKPTTEAYFFTTDEPFVTKSTEKSIWPERVKPGGGISDEAIMQIIKDVQNISKNSSDTSDTTARAAEIDADAVAQIIHDVKALQATTSELNYLLSTTDGRELDFPDTPKNKTKSSNAKKKKAGRGGKSQNNKNKNAGSKTSRTNSTRKQKRQRLRSTTRRPSLWERIVRAAANAFFGDSQTKPGLFQAEDIIDLISSL